MKNYSLPVKLFVAFLLLSIVPLLLFSSLFNYYITGYSEMELSKSNIEKLELIDSSIIQLTDSLTQVALRTSTSKLLNDLYGIDNYYSRPRNAQDISKLSQAMSIITDITKTNEKLYSVYLYLENTDYVLTTDMGAFPKEEFYDIGWIETYRQYMEGNTPISWIARSITSQDASAGKTAERSSYDQVFTYIFPLTSYTTNLRGAIAFNIKENEISKMINNKHISSDGYICMADSKGELVSHIDKRFLGGGTYKVSFLQKVIDFQSERGYFIEEINNKRHLITFLKSDFNEYFYIAVLSLDPLMAKTNALRIRILYIVLTTIAIVIIISLIISRKLYNPMRKLIQQIRTKKEVEFSKSDDEISIIAKAFDTITKQEEQMFDIFEKNKRKIKENYFHDLLNGNINSENGYPGLDLIHDIFICIVVQIDQYKGFTEKYSQEGQYYMKAVIINVCEEIIADSYKCDGVMLDGDRIAIVINMNGPFDSRQYKVINDILKTIQIEMAKVLDNSLSFGVGCAYAGKAGIKKSYTDALEAIKYRLIKGHGCRVSWWELQQQEATYYYPYIKERNIVNCLSLSLENEAALAVEELVNDLRKKDGLTYENTIQIIYQLVGSIIKYTVDSSINFTEIYGNYCNLYQNISLKETLEEIKLYLVDLLRRIIKYNTKNQSEHNNYMDEMIDFIHKNFCREIDIGTIADHLGICYSYARKIFKEKTGKSIIEYVNELRIEEAKRLLTQTNISIRDAASALGYNNDQSFSRCFKKYEGITPGEFRNKA